MIAIGLLFVRMLCDCFKSQQQLEAEIMVLRHELNVLQQRAPRRPHLRWADRALFIWLYRRCPRILDTITIVRARDCRALASNGFRRFLAMEVSFWGAPKIPGELLKLGIDVAPLSHTGLRLPFALPAAKAGHIGHPNCLCCGERSGRRRPGCEFGAAGRQRDRSFGPVMASMMASAECAMNRQTMGWCAHNELTFDGGEDTLHSTTPADW
jgi:hypothetical protein